MFSKRYFYDDECNELKLVLPIPRKNELDVFNEQQTKIIGL